LRRLVQYLIGRTLFDDHPIIHEDDPVGDVAGEAYLMRNDAAATIDLLGRGQLERGRLAWEYTVGRPRRTR
jgi:hypothetical protein